MALGLGGGEAIIVIPPPEVARPGDAYGGQAGSQFPSDQTSRARRVYEQIQADDEMIVKVLKAFLEMMNR